MSCFIEIKGKLKFTKALKKDQIEAINSFCDERHGDSGDPYEEFPWFYCHWSVSKNGRTIGWDGGENAYYMAEWLTILYKKFLTGWGVGFKDGEVYVRGDNPFGVWILCVENNDVSMLIPICCPECFEKGKLDLVGFNKIEVPYVEKFSPLKDRVCGCGK